MNKDQFKSKHVKLNIGETELNHKYLAYLREQEDMQRMYEAVLNSQQAQSSTAVGAFGGGTLTTPVPPSPGSAITILEYATTQGATVNWGDDAGTTFTLDPTLPNFSYTLDTTYIPQGPPPTPAALIGVTIGNTVVSIDDYAFFECALLSSVTFEPISTLTSIGNSAFEGCSTLVSITIPSSVTSIGANAFRICEVLASITIPNSVTNIGNYAFNFTNLTTVTFTPTSTLAIIGDGAFANTPLASITIPNSVTSISGDAFEFCTALTTVTIANGQLGITSPSASQAFFGVTVQTILPV